MGVSGEGPHAPLGTFDTSILTPSALELGVPRVLFLGNDPWFNWQLPLVWREVQNHFPLLTQN